MVLIQAVMLMTGVLMIAAPGALTRKQDRNDPAAIKKTKTLGYWLFFAAVIWMVSAAFM